MLGLRNDMILNVAKLIFFFGGVGAGEFLASRAELILRPTVFLGHNVVLRENFQLHVME